MKIKTQHALVLLASLSASSVFARPLGIAVSAYTGSINWPEVAADGVTFAFTKATEGNYFEDSYYDGDMTGGKAAGILMGAYEFARPDLDTPAQEAAYFWNYAKKEIKADGKTLMPMIDFETFNGHVGTSTYTQWFNQWSAAIVQDGENAGVTLRPVIYVSACAGACDLNTNIKLGAFIANENGEDYQTGNPWNVCTGCNAWDPGSTGGWIYWEFGTGSITGISGEVSLLTFNGTLADLKATEVVTPYP